MLMNTMEALGAGQALSPKGEHRTEPGADAETLALFASMFAMMQTSQPGSANIVETSADNQAPQKQPGSEGWQATASRRCHADGWVENICRD